MIEPIFLPLDAIIDLHGELLVEQGRQCGPPIKSSIKRAEDAAHCQEQTGAEVGTGSFTADRRLSGTLLRLTRLYH